MRLVLAGCPAKGLRMSGRDQAMTASASPSVNSVPIRRPSLPSRAISTANSSRCLRTSLRQPWSFVQMIPNDTGSGFLATPLPCWEAKSHTYKIRTSQVLRTQRLRYEGVVGFLGVTEKPLRVRIRHHAGESLCQSLRSPDHFEHGRASQSESTAFYAADQQRRRHT